MNGDVLKGQFFHYFHNIHSDEHFILYEVASLSWQFHRRYSSDNGLGYDMQNTPCYYRHQIIINALNLYEVLTDLCIV